jgi:hypothetical protein
MQEIICNLHMHTTYSDGHANHAQIAEAAWKAGIDAIITTDHNVWVNGLEGYYPLKDVPQGNRFPTGKSKNLRVLLLIGEEIHDPLRQPQKNHLLAFGANQELAPFSDDPQQLINRIRQAGGAAYIAHPFDDAMPSIGEDDLSWVDWDIEGFTGIELWNGMSEIKSVSHSRLQAIFYAFFPSYMPHQPLDRTLKLWDQLLASGKKVAAIGGSDAHALPLHLGPIKRTVYPYEFHFRCVNTHLLLGEDLTGNLEVDRQKILEALRQGHAFIGYDLPAPTRGFRFNAQGRHAVVEQGDEISLESGVTLQVRLPQKSECRLLAGGKVLKSWRDREICSLTVNHPGAYRVEVYIHYLGARRGWIFSNPIYVRD